MCVKMSNNKHGPLHTLHAAEDTHYLYLRRADRKRSIALKIISLS